MIKSTEGLSKDDRDNLLSQLRDQVYSASCFNSALF